MTEKMKFETKDLTQENIAKIGQLFPEVLTEAKDDNGTLKKAIDFDKLRQILSNSAIDNRETYDFTWVGKKQAILEAATPIRKTLRPCKEESVNWDTTQNLYIEGDNLDVLKLLQESYLGKVKMIYIDPPYNTGNDILYKNAYGVSEQEYENLMRDDEGNLLVVNSESNGRFHSEWCSMMYERIKLAKNLLREDGFFCIAIDHNELFNLGEICDEIFGYINRIGLISVVHKPEGRNQAKFIGPSNEFMLIYIKNDKLAHIRKVALDEEQEEQFDLNDEIGAYRLKNFIRLSDGKYSLRENKPDFWYPIYVSPDMETITTIADDSFTPVYPITDMGIERTWKTTKGTCLERCKNKDIIAKKENGKIVIYEKLRESQVIKTHWINKKYHGFHFGTKILDELLGVKSFDFPKSLYLMYDIVKLFTERDDIILDFFSGSATTAHAVMKLNADEKEKRRFIMVQIPAACDVNSPAYKAGYKNICEIGKERIRRAAKQIKEEHPESNFDGGFRVFKLADSNMKDVYYNPAEYTQDLLDKMTSNIKEDRNDMDLLYGCMLEWGLPLSYPHTSEKVGSYTIHTVNNSDLVACFDENITEDIIRHIAAKKPLRVVFRDAGFTDSPAKINVGELFKLLSPDTKVKVI